MRIGLMLTLALSWTLLGANCVPMLDIVEPTAVEGEKLAAAVLAPAADHTVPVGQTLRIEWTATNLTGQEAIVTILVETRPGLEQTILAGGLKLDQARGPRLLDWDTTGFDPGAYAAVVTVQAGTLSRRATGSGIITLDQPPSFQFTAPEADATLEPDATLTIAWTGADPEGNAAAQIGIDPDTDHQSGNEVILTEQPLPRRAEAGSFEWDGTDQEGVAVEAGTYNLFALVDDGVSPALTVEGLAGITVPEPQDGSGAGPGQTAFTQPQADSDFVVGDDPLTIAYTLSLSEDVLLDLKIDTDDNHANGNELTILAQRSLTADTEEDSFDWDGSDAQGQQVDPGIYRIFMVLSTGSGSPTTVEADALVFRRSSATQPLISLLEPASVQTLDPGDFLTIRWRDDDPGGNATVRIAIDDDKTPGQSNETGAAEIDILTGRDAADDGVLDSFTYQIPSALEPGSYYVFGYITSGGGTFLQQQSVAPAVFIVNEPAGGG